MRMNIFLRKHKRGQSAIELAITVAAVAVAAIFFSIYLRRASSGYFRKYSATMGAETFSPTNLDYSRLSNTSDFRTNSTKGYSSHTLADGTVLETSSFSETVDPTIQITTGGTIAAQSLGGKEVIDAITSSSFNGLNTQSKISAHIGAGVNANYTVTIGTMVSNFTMSDDKLDRYYKD